MFSRIILLSVIVLLSSCTYFVNTQCPYSCVAGNIARGAISGGINGAVSTGVIGGLAGAKIGAVTGGAAGGIAGAATGATVGTVAGAVGGTVVGGVLGTVLGPVGTVAGAGIGKVVGAGLGLVGGTGLGSIAGAGLGAVTGGTVGGVTGAGVGAATGAAVGGVIGATFGAVKNGVYTVFPSSVRSWNCKTGPLSGKGQITYVGNGFVDVGPKVRLRFTPCSQRVFGRNYTGFNVGDQIQYSTFVDSQQYWAQKVIVQTIYVNRTTVRTTQTIIQTDPATGVQVTTQNKNQTSRTNVIHSRNTKNNEMRNSTTTLQVGTIPAPGQTVQANIRLGNTQVNAQGNPGQPLSISVSGQQQMGSPASASVSVTQSNY